MADKTKPSSPAGQKPPRKRVKLVQPKASMSNPPPPQASAPPTKVTKLPVAPKDETVEVLCANTTSGLHLDKQLLYQVSADFAQRITTRLKEEPAEPLVVRVPHSEPAFEVLKRWLYGGPVRQQDATLGLAEELHVLMDAHSVGEVLNTSEFQDEVVDAIIKIVMEHGHKFTIARLSPPKVKGFPARTSKLRELLADWIAYGEFDEGRSDSAQLPKDGDFSRLLAATFVERKIARESEAPWVTGPCKYHVHRKTAVCPSKGIKTEAKD
ncbi:hypothetical protein PRZ48_000987 [Zasmidium cellare]|uniref:BTB domain-containing protein n=1 Tax=Zasmidium cellare TaxID=395010 RepID=A0ABR0F016_ZASCE|nr:hypothetical protein PRZ48_000987 [Zasmidium cellare]